MYFRKNTRFPVLRWQIYLTEKYEPVVLKLSFVFSSGSAVLICEKTIWNNL